MVVLQREGEHSSVASHSQGAATEIASSGTSLVSGLDSNSPPCLVKVRLSLFYYKFLGNIFYWYFKMNL